jgi:hypothetical protein
MAAGSILTKDLDDLFNFTKANLSWVGIYSSYDLLQGLK